MLMEELTLINRSMIRIKRDSKPYLKWLLSWELVGLLKLYHFTLHGNLAMNPSVIVKSFSGSKFLPLLNGYYRMIPRVAVANLEQKSRPTVGVVSLWFRQSLCFCQFLSVYDFNVLVETYNK